MLGSFQILDGDQPRRRHDGGMYWRGVFPRAEAEIIPGSWEVTGLRGTGSFDWTVNDFFLPERRTMVHAGVPLDNQWEHWPGITYALPAQCWVGPHQCAVITGWRAPASTRWSSLPAGRRRAAARACCATIRRCRTRSAAPMRSSIPDASIATR